MNTAELAEVEVNLDTVCDEIVNSYLYCLGKEKRCWAYMLWGAPGIGKTAMANTIASKVSKSLNEPVQFYAMASSTSEPWDFAGPLMRSNNGDYAEYVPVSFIYKASEQHEDKSPMVILLDDLVTAHPQTQAAAMKLIHELRAGEHVLRRNVLIIAAGNRTTDNSGANPMLKAMGNRFRHRYCTYDKDVTVKHGRDAGWHPLVLAYLEVNPQDLFTFKADSPEEAFATPRSWENVSDYLWEIGRKPVDTAPFNHYAQIAGIVGRGVAISFGGFVAVTSRCVPPEVILNDPMNAPIPGANEPDILWATICALEDHVRRNPETWGNALIYSVRDGLNEDVACMLAANATMIPHKMEVKQRFAEFKKYEKALVMATKKYQEVLTLIKQSKMGQ